MRRIILLLGLVVFLSACSGGGDGSLPSTAHAFSGNDGVTINFLDDVFDDEYLNPKEDDTRQIKIGVQVLNEGAVDTDNILLVLSTEGNVISSRIRERVLSLFGRARLVAAENNIGGRSLVDFDAVVHHVKLPPSGVWNSIIEVAACYPYETRAGQTICINTKHFSLSDIKPLCETKDVKLRTQGAPVAVTRIETILEGEGAGITSVRPTFRIFIKNVGGGEIIQQGNYQVACRSEGVGENYYDQIRVSGSFGIDALECEQTLRFKRNDQENFVTCESSRSYPVQDPVFERQLEVVLSYGYKVVQSKIVTIE